MKWTTTPPTKPGWYWAIHKDETKRTQCVELRQNPYDASDLQVWPPGVNIGKSPFKQWWPIPITPPPLEGEDAEEVALKNLAMAVALVDHYAGCGDNSCLFRPPSGMGTNGGCRCLGRGGDTRPGLATALGKLLRDARAAIAAVRGGR